MSNKNILWLVIGLIAVGALAVVGYIVYPMSAPNPSATPSRPNGICTMEAKQCPDGSSVGRQGPNCEFAACPTPQVPPTSGGGCMTGGCSNEICQGADEDPAVSICLYRSEFACYKTAKCERQTNGKCGWTQTAALQSCLQNPPEAQ